MSGGKKGEDNNAGGRKRRRGTLMLRPPTLRPLMTPTQTLKPLNLMTQKRFDHVTLSPKSGRIVRPTKIVTLRPQKVGRSVTLEHYDPMVF
jgi:hypothetical protein